MAIKKRIIMRKRTLAIKEINGAVKIIDVETGEEIQELSAAFLRV